MVFQVAPVVKAGQETPNQKRHISVQYEDTPPAGKFPLDVSVAVVKPQYQ